MNDNIIRVLLVNPGEAPKTIELENTLDSMQEAVEGYIEEIYIADDIALICNEEGKINSLPLNRAIYDDKGKMVDIIAGSFFIVYAPSNSEKFLSLSDEQIRKYEDKFKYPEYFFKVDGEIVVVKSKD